MDIRPSFRGRWQATVTGYRYDVIRVYQYIGITVHLYTDACTGALVYRYYNTQVQVLILLLPLLRRVLFFCSFYFDRIQHRMAGTAQRSTVSLHARGTTADSRVLVDPWRSRADTLLRGLPVGDCG